MPTNITFQAHMRPRSRSRSRTAPMALAAITVAMAAACCAGQAMAQVPVVPVQSQPQTAPQGVSRSIQSRYDFAYQSSDPRVLVFDDGENTRIQLPPGVLLPTVIGQTNQGEAVLALQVQSPYLLTNGLYQRLTLRWANGQQVQIQYQGRVAVADRNGQAVAYAPIAPQTVYAPVARPVEVGQANLSNQSSGANRYVQTSMVTAPAPGVVSPRGTAAARPAPAATNADTRDALANTKSLLSNEQFFFDFQVADGTISGTLKRWADAQGFELVWELPPELDPRIARAQTWNKPLTFKQAIEQVARRMQARGYPVGIHIYTDGVIRFSVDADADLNSKPNPNPNKTNA